VPGVDTESYYVRGCDWNQMSPFFRVVLTFNQTIMGRLLIGPVLRLWLLAKKETGRIQRKEFGHLPHWLVHVAAVAAMFWFISGVCHFPWWQYCLLMAYPGLSLSLLRAFTEHRAALLYEERTASVESNVVFGVLYLYNNLHVAHHVNPTIAWYDLPRFYRDNRDSLLRQNGSFVYKGYAELAWKYFFTPVFRPIHPNL
jgi:fatty acid desaturase